MHRKSRSGPQLLRERTVLEGKECRHHRPQDLARAESEHVSAAPPSRPAVLDPEAALGGHERCRPGASLPATMARLPLAAARTTEGELLKARDRHARAP